MTEISPGSVCTVRKFGARLWVAKEPLPDHRGEFNRWRLVCKQVDNRGRCAYQTRIAGIGDITVIRDAEVFQSGDVIERHDGRRFVVLRDLGDGGVELAVPEDRVPLRGGHTVRVAAGNSTLVSKADLLLDALKLRRRHNG